MQIWTVGHSNKGLEDLCTALESAAIQRLLDVRRFPMSRRNPQFNSENLTSSLEERGIEYRHEPGLGGRRKPVTGSFNLGLRDEGFRGFADYMLTEEFGNLLAGVIESSARARTAIMCAEAVPWRCHRSLIADALLVRGVAVVHLVGGRERPHTLSLHARVQDGRVTYPALL